MTGRIDVPAEPTRQIVLSEQTRRALEDPNVTVGYVSGVYDMFHIGHLNIIVRARELCDYLIAGVASDEVVMAGKGRTTVIPLEERVAIVGGLRVVDDVIIDPFLDKMDTWRQLHYDALFKGDDWKDSPVGKKLAADLESVGARLHFFPYTRQTSSSLLRDVLGKLAETPVEMLPEEETTEAPGLAAPRVVLERCETCGHQRVV